MNFIKKLLGVKKDNGCCDVEIKEIESEKNEQSCCESDGQDNKCCP